jgi:hypothetical protein
VQHPLRGLDPLTRLSVPLGGGPPRISDPSDRVRDPLRRLLLRSRSRLLRLYDSDLGVADTLLGVRHRLPCLDHAVGVAGPLLLGPVQLVGVPAGVPAGVRESGLGLGDT